MNGIWLSYISINILAAFCGIPEAKLTYNQPTYFRGKPRERTDSWQTQFSTACKPIIETVRSWRHCNRRKSDPCLCFSTAYLRELVVSGTKTKSPGADQSSCPLPLFPRPDRSKYRHLITLLRTVIHWPGFFFSFSLGYESQICYSNGKRFVELSLYECCIHMLYFPICCCSDNGASCSAPWIQKDRSVFSKDGIIRARGTVNS